MSKYSLASTPSSAVGWRHPPRLLSSNHRTYRDPESLHNTSAPVVCAPVDNETLIKLADAADRIELRSSALSTRAIPAAASLLLDALRALSCIHAAADAGQKREQLRRQIVDQRARLRIKWNQDLLAGSASLPIAEGNQQVLLLVLARHDIRSCDWHLAA
jgi:hypothetical protein